MKRPRIGVVLGAGAARGWSHIGALEALETHGVPIDVVCGASSGALVAASYATGRLSALKRLASGMTQTRMLRFFDLSLAGGGVIEGRWIVEFMRANIGDVPIDECAIRFGAVATEYRSGREVWFTSGSVIDAVRASIALPGLLTPVQIDGRWLVDGALVDPLPVTLCRSLGADVIIAINTGGDVTTSPPPVVNAHGQDLTPYSSWLAWMAGAPAGPVRPGYVEVLGDALTTMQNFIARIRLAADPPDILINPNLAGVNIMDFHKGAAAIEAGANAVDAAMDKIRAVCGGDGGPAGPDSVDALAARQAAQ